MLFYVEVFAFLALALAAPVCFCLATFGMGGDRWTVRYAMAWLALLVAYCVVGLTARVTNMPSGSPTDEDRQAASRSSLSFAQSRITVRRRSRLPIEDT